MTCDSLVMLTIHSVRMVMFSDGIVMLVLMYQMIMSCSIVTKFLSSFVIMISCSVVNENVMQNICDVTGLFVYIRKCILSGGQYLERGN